MLAIRISAIDCWSSRHGKGLLQYVRRGIWVLMRMGELKQIVMNENNGLNQEIFGVGLRWQKVVVLEDKILVLAENQRVPALASLDRKDPSATKAIDHALLGEFKEKMLLRLEKSLGVSLRGVLKDYDPVLELACMLIVFDRPVTELVTP